jgi:hypothetical protein
MSKRGSIFVKQSTFPVRLVSIPNHICEVLENEGIVDPHPENLVGLCRLFGKFVAAGTNDELWRPLRIGSTEGQRFEHVNVAGCDHLNVGRQRLTDRLRLDGIVDLVLAGRLITSDPVER